MATKPKYKSDAFEAIHSAASALHRAGAIGKTTMRQFDDAALSAPEPLAPVQIKKIREQAKVSQAVFARRLNTSASTVEKWETGAKKPSGVALKMLAVVRKHGLAVLD
ncbi:DNA-binding transcriptional regulator [Gemmatimonas sp.]|jgi:putative transcriptional regulator|uniref:helix-turn-helix domain-containing protein n=1 Tax=Gemmatimonas sp. TaxID=1962908 RepID=UPI0022CBF952|nr:DNA-binding transcriptional regulator [Gemmatimonas sp.]MCZ8205236.1 DNA-binding transcriptional regulator [Gemmatimonas sp.]